MCVKAVRRAFLVIGNTCDDLERVESSLGRFTDVDHLAVELLSKNAILILRVKNKDLTVICGEVGQNSFCGEGFTGTGLSYDRHITVYTLAVTLEEVDENRISAGRSEAHSVLVLQIWVYERESCRNGRGMNTAALLYKCIMGRNMRACVHVKGLHKQILRLKACFGKDTLDLFFSETYDDELVAVELPSAARL